MSKKRLLWSLFLTLFKIGLFTFGGGYAMISLMEREFVEKKHWLEKDEFLTMLAVAESTPGPVAINNATYVGFKNAGVLGAAASTLGVVLPSFIIIFLISLVFDWFYAFQIVQYAFRGIQICVVYLILSVGVKLLKGLKKSLVNYLIFGAVLVASILISLFDVGISAIWLILASGFAGYLVFAIKKTKEASK